ncbi:MFS transporter [Brevibacillus fluminis]|uniref:MFS transporter n=1 Tax=Brevibacillus fluminis TaxID=511487 RepID=A0A3M8DUI0_9BACL|nr:MFS transporter [Brevibacillus fluminis]RNB91159.1 MFS transporter [Brevibacillus fluminis]
MAQNTKNLIGITGVPFVMVLGNSMLIPVLPAMKGALGLTSLQSSFLITAFSIAAGLVIPIAGYLSDRFPRKKVIMIALIIYGIGGLLAGFAAMWWKNPYPIILAGRFLQGIGAAGTAPIAMALVGDLFNGSSESKALGLLETSNGLGKVLSPIIGSLLGLIAWYMVFLAFPVICCLLLVMFLWLVTEKKKTVEPLPFGAYKKAVGAVLTKHKQWLWAVFLIGSVCLFTLFGVLYYLSERLEEEFKIEGVLKGGILAIPLLAMSIMAYLTGIMIKQKLNRMRWFIITGMLLLSASYVAAGFVKNVYILIGILTVGSVGSGMILPCLNSMITGAVKKSERGMLTSLYNGVRFIGVAIGPPVFSWLIKISSNVMFMSVAVLAFVSAAVAFFFIKPENMELDAASKEQQEAKKKEQDAIRKSLAILGIEQDGAEMEEQHRSREQFGFNINEMVDQLLKQKEKEK